MDDKTIRITCEGYKTLPIAEIVGLQGNLKKLSEPNYQKLKKLIIEHGFSFPINIAYLKGNPHGVIDGHQRHYVIKRMIGEGFTIEKPELPITRTDVKNKKEAKRLILAAISQFGKIDNDGLTEFLESSEMGLDCITDFDLPDFDIKLDTDIKVVKGENDIVNGNEYNTQDIIFKGDKYGIPLLDINKQCLNMLYPFSVWGETKRGDRKDGITAFYTDDYRFNAIWVKPDALLETGCKNILELNYSSNNVMPEAVGIYNTFRKRWLSKYWQTKDINIIVDLNVDIKFEEINLLGVPIGWRSYATRGITGNFELLKHHYDIAMKHAGTDDIFFICYGGGIEIKKFCEKHHLFFIENLVNQMKEKVYGSK